MTGAARHAARLALVLSAACSPDPATVVEVRAAGPLHEPAVRRGFIDTLCNSIGAVVHFELVRADDFEMTVRLAPVPDVAAWAAGLATHFDAATAAGAPFKARVRSVDGRTVSMQVQ